MENGCYVGIDVSKDRLDVHILPQAHSVSVANDHRGVAELIKNLEHLTIERVVLEGEWRLRKILLHGNDRGGYRNLNCQSSARQGFRKRRGASREN